MQLIKFKQFESVHDALSKDGLSPIEIAESGVANLDPATAGLIAERLNEKDFKDLLNEGIFDRLKNFLEKGIPGSTVRKADQILAGYKQTKLHTLEELGKERIKIFKLKTKSDAEPENKLLQSQFQEVWGRGQKVMTTIENAEKAKLDAIEQQLRILMKGAKKDRVKTYIDMKLAKLKEEVAKAEIEDAKAYTSDDQMAKLQEIVNMRQQLVDLNAKKAKMQAELDSKGGKQEVKRPQPGETYKYFSKSTTDKDTGEKGKKIDVTISDKQNPANDDDQITVIGSKKNSFEVAITDLEGFENYAADKEKTAGNNAGIDKLAKEIADMEAKIEAVKVWDNPGAAAKKPEEKKDNLAPTAAAEPTPAATEQPATA